MMSFLTCIRGPAIGSNLASDNAAALTNAAPGLDAHRRNHHAGAPVTLSLVNLRAKGRHGSGRYRVVQIRGPT